MQIRQARGLFLVKNAQKKTCPPKSGQVQK